MKILPLALAQFIASYAATNMNVAISTIAHDLGTTITGVQTVIAMFTLVMAALMVPGSKLTDLWGRRRCFALGLSIYGAGALIAALARNSGTTSASAWAPCRPGCSTRPIIRTCHHSTSPTSSRPATSRSTVNPSSGWSIGRR